MKTSIIVCAYTEKRWQDLVNCIEALQMQRLAADQILLIIDHNKALFARSQEAFKKITIIENNRARGLSGARNSGLDMATGEIIAFIDEDAVAAPDWLEKLVAAYSDDGVLGTGGLIEPNWVAGKPSWFPTEFNWVVGCSYKGLPETTATVRNLIGCNMSFRKSVFDGVGAFRDGIGRIGTLPVGCEETELCIRALQHWPDGKFMYEPSAKVAHNVTSTRGTWAYFRTRCYAEGISKAQIASFVGANDGLSSERSYATKTLPLGLLRNLATGNFRRGVAIVAGLFITTFGYLRGELAKRQNKDVSIKHGERSAVSLAGVPQNS